MKEPNYTIRRQQERWQEQWRLGNPSVRDLPENVQSFLENVTKSAFISGAFSLFAMLAEVKGSPGIREDDVRDFLRDRGKEILAILKEYYPGFEFPGWMIDMLETGIRTQWLSNATV